MDKKEVIELAIDFIANSADNRIKVDSQAPPELVGKRIYDAPIFGFCEARDEVFAILKQPKVIGCHFRKPHEWLPTAQTVISFFLPYSEAVKASNREQKIWPSWGWLVGRVEGHILLQALLLELQMRLKKAGYATIIPTMDKKFFSITEPIEEHCGEPLAFTSNWSERHIAYLCGLGTFGLSKGLITEKGIAGRFGSLVTELQLEPNQRPYQSYNAYCTQCGACVKQCPVNGISIEKGKDHQRCSIFLDKTAQKFAPRYGCGKCQVKVPCESGIPARNQ
ncbi:MAG: 4Fe-4S binding protein [Acetobacterium sp.]|nr:4Fe-4S binding protein [Acetobacterium sp.]